jgi:hypothetical protein
MARRTIGVVLVAVTAFTIGAAAQAASGWKPFATGTDSGQYGSYANASGDVTHPKGLAIRARTHSGTADVTYFFDCSGELKTAHSGVVYVLAIASAAKCSVNGSANTDSSNVTVQLLKR